MKTTWLTQLVSEYGLAHGREESWGIRNISFYEPLDSISIPYNGVIFQLSVSHLPMSPPNRSSVTCLTALFLAFLSPLPLCDNSKRTDSLRGREAALPLSHLKAPELSPFFPNNISIKRRSSASFIQTKLPLFISFFLSFSRNKGDDP